MKIKIGISPNRIKIDTTIDSIRNVIIIDFVDE